MSTAVEQEHEAQAPTEQPDGTGRDQGPRTVVAAAVRALVLTAFGAMVCLAPLELSMQTVSGDAELLPGAAFAGWLVVWAVLLGLVGLTGRVRWALTLGLLVACGLAMANALRLKALLVPLLPSDLAFLASPGPMLEIVGPGRVVGVLVVLLLLGAGLVVGLRRLQDSPYRIRRGLPGARAWAVVRLVMVVQALAVLAAVPSFNEPGNPLRSLYDRMGAYWMPWSQGANYMANGFVGGMLYNVPTQPMAEPEGYSRAAMAEVARRWTQVAAQESSSDSDAAPAAGFEGVNVVLVLSESLGDPTTLSTKFLDEDPLAGLRELSSREWSGQTAGVYGTGTSGMEFQVLTGQSLGLFAPQLVSPYQQFLASMDEYPSLVGWLGSTGHRTVAVHPFTSEMYKRTDVYDVLGFDEFVTEADMDGAERASKEAFISDAAAYDEVLEQLDASDDPVLAHLVTMQNHVPFAFNPDPLPVTGLEGADTAQIGDWARGLKTSDAALQQFLADLEARDEPTVVLFFGDHFPGIFPSDMVQSEGLAMRTTPLLVWSSDQPSEHEDLGVVSPTAFMSVLADRLQVSKPPYLHLLEEVQERIGTIRDGVAISPDGRETPVDQLDDEQKALLRDYRLVQYDFSIGERWAVKDLWYDPDA